MRTRSRIQQGVSKINRVNREHRCTSTTSHFACNVPAHSPQGYLHNMKCINQYVIDAEFVYAGTKVHD